MEYSTNTITDTSGTVFTLTARPSRIVSLAPLLSESIHLLGCADKLVGVTTYCKFPPEIQTKEKIGAVQEPDIEKILTLKPDLILATLESNKPKVIQQLKDQGLRVFIFGKKKSFLDVELRFRQLAQWLDKADICRDILEEAGRRLRIVQKRISSLPRKKVFVQLSIKPLRTVVQNSFIDEMITRAGGINIAHDCSMPYPVYSLEDVVAQDPDIIIIPNLGNISSEAKKAWVGFPNITAVKQKKIFIFDFEQKYHLCSPTPLGFVQSVERIAQYLHPIK